MPLARVAHDRGQLAAPPEQDRHHHDHDQPMDWTQAAHVTVSVRATPRFAQPRGYRASRPLPPSGPCARASTPGIFGAAQRRRGVPRQGLCRRRSGCGLAALKIVAKRRGEPVLTRFVAVRHGPSAVHPSLSKIMFEYTPAYLRTPCAEDELCAVSTRSRPTRKARAAAARMRGCGVSCNWPPWRSGGPCSIVDLFLLWRGGTGTGGFVFGLLFRQALVFLALWFAVAASHGLMRGERRALDAPTKRQLRLFRRRTASDGKSFTAPSRGNRGQ